MALLAQRVSGPFACLQLTPLVHLVQLLLKIYLSAVRSLHIDLGFPDPLVDCLQLQRVLRGIRRTQGSPGPSHLPITDHHMLIIHNSLSFAIQDHVMFWAVSTLAYFGFLAFH